MRESPNRREIVLAAAGVSLLAFGRRPARTSELPEIKAFRNPGCGCCEQWAEHLEAAGFKVNMTEDEDLPGRRRSLGVPEAMAGCHLAQVGPYVIEGHVPAQDILTLLQRRPDRMGLAVPGMPIGSPGMEADGDSEHYAVLIFSADGSSEVFSRH
ncbi:MAG: DUF411 domain-containing protein [Pseudomonadota bacterium]|nr:DUF411 domain-containing protein [Pseudomonadota bacterium]